MKHLSGPKYEKATPAQVLGVTNVVFVVPFCCFIHCRHDGFQGELYEVSNIVNLGLPLTLHHRVNFAR